MVQGIAEVAIWLIGSRQKVRNIPPKFAFLIFFVM
jgi:hypothetical protein